MMVMHFSQRASRGSVRSATATLVSGPIAASTSSPSAFRACSMIIVTACRSTGRRFGSGRSAPSRPLAPWIIDGAKLPTKGAPMPPATGMSSPASSQIFRALRVVFSTIELPNTVVRPRNSKCLAA